MQRVVLCCETTLLGKDFTKLTHISFNQCHTEIVLWLGPAVFQCCLSLSVSFKKPKWNISVFLSGFGTFVRSELKYSKLPVKAPRYPVTCAIIKAICHSFNKLRMLWHIHANGYVQLSPTLSVAYAMLIKMYSMGSLLNSLTPKNIIRISSLHRPLHAKWLNQFS